MQTTIFHALLLIWYAQGFLPYRSLARSKLYLHAAQGIKLETSRNIPKDVAKSRKPLESDIEEIYKTYPFENKQLPVLGDRKNFWCGKFNDIFWHQNGDQVHVYIPITDEIRRSDIKAKFEVRKIDVFVEDQLELSFETMDSIIPDGSFWLIETDKDNKRYIQLDLEKRFPMINWKSLFKLENKAGFQVSDQQKELLSQLYNANVGMSKLTNKPPETVEEMMMNKALMDSIGNASDEDLMKAKNASDIISQLNSEQETKDNAESPKKQEAFTEPILEQIPEAMWEPSLDDNADNEDDSDNDDDGGNDE